MMSARGDSELGVRYAFRQVSNSRWKNLFEMMLGNTPMKGGEITNLKVGDPGNTDKPFEVDFDVTVSNYFDWSAPDPKLPLPVLGIALPPQPRRRRQQEAQIHQVGRSQRSRYGSQADDPHEVWRSPSHRVDVKRDYAEYHSVYKFDAGQLAPRARCELSWRKSRTIAGKTLPPSGAPSRPIRHRT